MASQRNGLGRRKEETLVALLTHRSVDDAARAMNISARTVFRWLKERDFAEAYREARRVTFSQSVARLQQMSGAAVSTLGKIMVDPQAPASSRVRAADCILERAAKAMEVEDLGGRITILEQLVEESKSGRSLRR